MPNQASLSAVIRQHNRLIDIVRDEARTHARDESWLRTIAGRAGSGCEICWLSSVKSVP